MIYQLSNKKTIFSTHSTTDDEICPICLDPIKEDEMILPCKHIFHAKCMAKWKKQCPSCRKDF